MTTQEELKRLKYTQYCNQCFTELGDSPITRVDVEDDDRIWYHYACSEECMAEFLKHNL